MLTFLTTLFPRKLLTALSFYCRSHNIIAAMVFKLMFFLCLVFNLYTKHPSCNKSLVRGARLSLPIFGQEFHLLMESVAANGICAILLKFLKKHSLEFMTVVFFVRFFFLLTLNTYGNNGFREEFKYVFSTTDHLTLL